MKMKSIKILIKSGNTYGNLRKQTNLYVITGGLGSGKSTLVNQLNMLGYHTNIEHASHFIKMQMIPGNLWK